METTALCPKCELSYKRKQTYPCDLCSKVYAYKYSLNRHLKRIHIANIEPVEHTTVAPVV